MIQYTITCDVKGCRNAEAVPNPDMIPEGWRRHFRYWHQPLKAKDVMPDLAKQVPPEMIRVLDDLILQTSPQGHVDYAHVCDEHPMAEVDWHHGCG